MVISDKARRLGETILICCVVTVLTGIWARGTADSKIEAYGAAKRTQIATIAGALRRYEIDHFRYPEVVNNLPFCEPFNVYGEQRCLGELVGPYLRADSITFDENKYIYMDREEYVFIAADIPADVGVATNNRCLIMDFEFWCIKLPK